jgi:hypothetical protein
MKSSLAMRAGLPLVSPERLPRAFTPSVYPERSRGEVEGKSRGSRGEAVRVAFPQGKGTNRLIRYRQDWIDPDLV